MEDVQRLSRCFLDSRRNWFGIRCKRLGEAQWQWKALHQACSRLLCCFRRYCPRESSLEILHWNLDPWSQMFLWLLNDDGEYPFWDLLTSNRYLYLWSSWKGLPFQGNLEHPSCWPKSWLGTQVDQRREPLCRETGSFCCCWRHLLLWLFLLYFLA